MGCSWLECPPAFCPRSLGQVRKKKTGQQGMNDDVEDENSNHICNHNVSAGLLRRKPDHWFSDEITWERLIAGRRESGENHCTAAASLWSEASPPPCLSSNNGSCKELVQLPFSVHTDLLFKFPAQPIKHHVPGSIIQRLTVSQRPARSF